MSIFAYILCVLLVATATTAVDDELGLTTAMLAEVKNAVEEDYEAAKKIVDKVLMTMNLEIPIETDGWPRKGELPYDTCIEFLKKGIEEKYSMVTNCSQPLFPRTDNINGSRDDLDMVMRLLEMSIDEPKDVTEFCAVWYDHVRDLDYRTALCKSMVRGGVPGMIERARDRINSIVGRVTSVVNIWVFKTIYYCLVTPRGGYTREAWSNACQKA